MNGYLERYALIPWRQDGIYKARDAVKLYKVKSAADKAADMAYEASDPRGLVVRTILIPVDMVTA